MSTALELAGLVAITVGVLLTFGVGPGILAGGLLAVLVGFALDGPVRTAEPVADDEVMQ